MDDYYIALDKAFGILDSLLLSQLCSALLEATARHLEMSVAGPLASVSCGRHCGGGGFFFALFTHVRDTFGSHAQQVHGLYFVICFVLCLLLLLDGYLPGAYYGLCFSPNVFFASLVLMFVLLLSENATSNSTGRDPDSLGRPCILL